MTLQADGTDEAERRARQDSVNPAYVPRNHVMQDAVKLADQGDYSEVRLISHHMLLSTAISCRASAKALALLLVSR